MRALPGPWRADRPAVADAALAAALAVVSVTSEVMGKPAEGPLWVTVPVALVMTGALVWRVCAPLATAAVVSAASLLQTLLDGASPGQLWSLAVFLVVTYSVAVRASEGRAAAGGAVVVGSLFVQEWADDGSDYLFIVLVFGGTWLLGRAVLTWRDRAATAVAQSDDKARLAVAEERLRLARELHDVVAHSLSVIAVQAEAAQAALAHDPELVAAPLRAVVTQARGATGEMRRLLGVLRSDDDRGAGGPHPGLAELEALIGGFRSAGLPVQLSVAGPLESVSPTVDLAAYRIVQEGLTNVLKHAGKVPTTVVVQRSPGEIRIEVSNTAGQGVSSIGEGTGHGLIGIRERVVAAGGELHYGPRDGGGFRLDAWLPTGEDPS